MSPSTEIRIAHSPDSDDAFMFYALTQGVLDTADLRIEHRLADIETLNRCAFDGTYEITALSFHAYAYLEGTYELMPAGASFGDGYGPVVVAARTLERSELAGVEVLVPGELTTACLVLRLWQPAVKTRSVPFDEIMTRVADDEAAAGVVIHEGQLTYSEAGLQAVQDLGRWWKSQTGGPLPLGGNGIRRDLPKGLKERLCLLLRQSVDYALEHRQEALAYATRFARELAADPRRADRFVGMYVNDWTRDYGRIGRSAVQLLLDRGHQAGLLPQPVKARFADLGRA